MLLSVIGLLQMDGIKMSTLIWLGQFFFKWRNYLFPIVVLSLYTSIPPQSILFDSARIESIADILAVFLVCLGVLIRFLVMGFGLVSRDGLKKAAHADTLFTKGMFGLSRNPLYLGNIIIYAGIFRMHGSQPIFVIGTLTFMFIYFTIIMSEEAYLAYKFGDAYAEYKARVPRLRLRLRNWRSAKVDMRFSWAKALLGEYNVATQAALMLGFAWWYESATQNANATIPLFSAMLISCAVVFAISMRTIKHDPSIRV